MIECTKIKFKVLQAIVNGLPLYPTRGLLIRHPLSAKKKKHDRLFLKNVFKNEVLLRKTSNYKLRKAA